MEINTDLESQETGLFLRNSNWYNCKRKTKGNCYQSL